MKLFPSCFAACLAAIALLSCLPVAHGAEVAQWDVFETPYESAKVYPNSYVEIEVDVVFQQGDKQWKVPAFWAGDKKWTVRFAPPVQGNYTYRVECTDKENPGLNGKEQTLSVAAYTGDNPLQKHGFVKVAPGKTTFEHADGTPFFWLGDTWWKNLCKRMTWEGFQELTADRKTKGFSVVQIVCGPYPDENFFAPSLENEGGQPYLANDMSVVNPKYFDFADRRLKHLADNGIVPAIVGAWGRGDCNSMQKFGVANIKRHWRYLVARYGAYLPRRNIYNWDGPEVKDLEPDVDWHVYDFDPATGRKFDQGEIKATVKAGGTSVKPVSFKENVPSPQDWVLVLENNVKK